ncbi:MAG: nuclear transport factor 2 family protein [Gemmatimonadales bacterium]|nr:nuclear transport factor 2 family protein [Gemmatimonadales bacterium]
MSAFRLAGVSVGLLSVLACAKPGSSLPADWSAQLLTVREQVWRDWFDGNPRLGEMLTDDFVGIGFGAGPWDTKETTLAGSKEFAASGSKLVSLTFPKTTTQQMGDAIIVYSDYELKFASAAGEETAQRGRATEVFVWKDGRWLHPGWHLDSGQ